MFVHGGELARNHNEVVKKREHRNMRTNKLIGTWNQADKMLHSPILRIHRPVKKPQDASAEKNIPHLILRKCMRSRSPIITLFCLKRKIASTDDEWREERARKKSKEREVKIG